MDLKTLFRIAIIPISIAACSSNPPEEDLESGIDLDPIIRDHENVQDAAIAWQHQERGGAAYREQAYVHVLGVRPDIDDPLDRDSSELPKGTAEIINAAESVSHGQDRAVSIEHAQSYSLYEMSRWERYCDSGKDMTEKDWLFVIDESGRGIPDSITGCSPPPFTYKTYLEAWESKCQHKSKLNDNQISITTNTNIPPSVCGKSPADRKKGYTSNRTVDA